MNIFVTSPCPVQSARYLDDARVVKMILETAQLLSTAVRYIGVDVGYKSTHVNHPCAIWVRASRHNYAWAVAHGQALAAEYTKRYGKIHKSGAVITQLAKYTNLFPDVGLTPFVNCAARTSLGIDFRAEPDTHTAYQLYLNERWDRTDKNPRYNGRPL